MALASALLASGDPQAAAEVMADLPTARQGIEDPWVEFLQGKGALFGPAREALHARVRLP